MTTLIAGAIVLGSASSFLMGFVPFFAALLTAVMLGVATASIRGIPLADLPLPGLLLLVTTQLAYGLGLLAQLGLSHLGQSRDRSPRLLPGSSWRAKKATPADGAADTLHDRHR